MRKALNFLLVLFASLCCSHMVAASDGIASDKEVVEAMLDNIHENGFNKCVGGLYINWNSQGVNYNGTASPDRDPCERHDPLTDLRYLTNLWRYKFLYKSNRYDSDIAEFTPVILSEFDNPKHINPRGWVYNELVTLAKLSSDSRYADAASAMLDAYYKDLAHKSRVDWTLEQASALIQSGNRQYASVGRARIAEIFSGSFDKSRNLFIWDNSTDKDAATIKTSQQLDLAIALARAGLTDEAREVFSGLSIFWDAANGGYYEGGDVVDGKLELKTKKTGGRMSNALILAHLLQDEASVSSFRQVILKDVYLPSFKGVVYEQRPDWSLYKIHGVTEDWVTSEAMGITVEALLEVNLAGNR